MGQQEDSQKTYDQLVVERIEKGANEILGNQEVITSLSTIKNNIHFINGTGDYEEKSNPNNQIFQAKLERFKTGDSAKELREFQAYMESDESEISNIRKEGEPESEEEALERINRELRKLYKKSIVENVVDELILAQKKDLEKELEIVNQKPLENRTDQDLSQNTIDNEQIHISNVTNLARQTFTEYPILELIASVHDFVKHNVGYKELGLHEIASTYVGPIALKAALKNHAKELGLDDKDIGLIVKLAQRAIYTHGFQEFIHNNTFNIDPDLNIGGFFGGNQLSLITEKDSLPKNQKNPTFSELMIAGINFVDALEGTSGLAFVKYNDFYNIKRIIGKEKGPKGLNNSVADYIKNDVLSSFNDNMNMKSGDFLKSQKIGTLNVRVTFNTLVRDTILYLVNNETNELSEIVGEENKNILLAHLNELEQLRQDLKDEFKEKMSTDETEKIALTRDKFNKKIEEFMRATHKTVQDFFRNFIVAKKLET